MAYTHHLKLQCQGKYATYEGQGLHLSAIYMLLSKLGAWVITPQSYACWKKNSHGNENHKFSFSLFFFLFFICLLFLHFLFFPAFYYILFLPLVLMVVWCAHHKINLSSQPTTMQILETAVLRAFQTISLLIAPFHNQTMHNACLHILGQLRLEAAWSMQLPCTLTLCMKRT